MTAGVDADGQETRASTVANNNGITRHNNKARGRFYFLLGKVSFCSPLAEELFGKYSRIKKRNKFRSVGRPTDLNIFQNPYKMTKKRPCKKNPSLNLELSNNFFAKNIPRTLKIELRQAPTWVPAVILFWFL